LEGEVDSACGVLPSASTSTKYALMACNTPESEIYLHITSPNQIKAHSEQK
jgi:hypothetical protein